VEQKRRQEEEGEEQLKSPYQAPGALFHEEGEEEALAERAEKEEPP
jgi:hypothetical protein